MNKKRVAIICSTDYMTYPMGGMMSFIVDILPYLAKEFEITLWGVSTNNDSVSNINLYGRTYPLKIFSKVKLTKKIIPNIFRVILDIQLKAKQILEEGYDILYFHGIPLSFPFLKKKNEKSTPKIVNHVHGITNPFAVNRNKIINNALMINLYDRYRNKVIKESDMILLASDKESYNSLLVKFDKEISQKIHYIPNFADPSIFTLHDKIEARKLLQLPIGQDILVNTGRLNIQKDPFLLLDAFAYLNKELHSNALLFLIGDGDLRDELEQKIKTMQIAENVRMLGRLERKAVALWLNASDLYVYTSFGNGFPIALIEAAMCGLPIVSTDVTGVHDLIFNDKTGYLASGRDHKDIAYKIKKALEKKDILRNNILEVSRSYTVEDISRKIRELFSMLCK
ncbi:MAG: glycosyltransferase family 4 protein [Nitrospirota bacterium]